MRPQITTHKAKTWQLCFLIVLCLFLECGAAPGSCKHSVTEDHVKSLDRLIGNQILGGCFIRYNFTERHNLTEVCYVKAAFPYILDLLKTHFTYRIDSDNYKYTSALERLYYNIYSQQCIATINEAIEESPVKFARLYASSPAGALAKTKLVIQMYRNLMIKNRGLVEWNCEDEYAKEFQDYSSGNHRQPREQIKAPKFTPVGFESHPTKVPSSSSSSSTVSSADQPRTLLPKEPTFQKTHESNPADSSERFMLHESTWKSSDTNNAGSSPHFLTGLSQDTPPATARPNP